MSEEEKEIVEERDFMAEEKRQNQYGR